MNTEVELYFHYSIKGAISLFGEDSVREILQQFLNALWKTDKLDEKDEAEMWDIYMELKEKIGDNE